MSLNIKDDPWKKGKSLRKQDYLWPGAFWGRLIGMSGCEGVLLAASQDLMHNEDLTPEMNVLAQGLDDAMDILTFREREVLKLRFGLTTGYTYTLEEVGRIFKVTRERVRGIEEKALSKLRSRPALSRLFCDSEDLPPPCPCSKCSEKFWTPDALGAHEAARHPKDPA